MKEVMLLVGAGFLIVFGVGLLTSWILMLGLGVAHGYWPQVPAAGYWATYLLLASVSVVGGAFGNGIKIKKDD